MTPEHWKIISSAFEKLRDCPTDEQPAMLDNVCAGQEEIREEILALLRAHANARGVMDQPSSAVSSLISTPFLSKQADEQVGHYKIIREIARGGFGPVFLVRDTKLNRLAAIKFLSTDHILDGQTLRRFSQEARAASALNHPNVVTIYEAGELNGIPYVVMEHVDGQTLRQRLTSTSLAVREAVDIAKQVADALTHAHANRIIHRDIKPENIMITAEGRVKVLDFGIAKYALPTDLDEGSEIETLRWSNVLMTMPGILLGTPEYMSPEQARGLKVDGRTDIWSLGAVLYEMLTGSPSFKGQTTLDTIGSIHFDVPLPLTRFNKEIPDELQRIVDKALAKHVDKRYKDSRALQNDLDKLIRELGNGSDGDEEARAETELDSAIHRRACPFRGLLHFDEAHSGSFFGREEFTKRIQTAVERFPLAVLTGGSGYGKSSVIFAGLVPQLRQRGGWEFIRFRPGAQPFHSLAQALSSFLQTHVSDSRRASKEEALAQDLKKNKRLLWETVKEGLKATKQQELLLVIDQFEELFTSLRRHEDDESCSQFLDSLAYLVHESKREHPQRIKLLISLRIDFLGQFPQGHKFTAALHQVLNRNPLFLDPMDDDGIKAAIVKPLSKIGYSLEEGLKERMIDDVRSSAGGLPLLEFTLESLWHQQKGKRLTNATYQRLGGVKNSLALYAEDVFKGLNETEQNLTELLFLKLVSSRVPDVTLQTPPRLIIARSTLESNTWDVVKKLADKRLLVTDRTANEDTVEIVHESLIEHWPRLKDWIQSHRDFLQWHFDLRTANKKYRIRKSAEFLLKGSDLEEAKKWLDRISNSHLPYSVDKSERDFIQDSMRLHERAVSRSRRRNLFIVAGTVAGVTMTILFVIGVKYYIAKEHKKAMAKDMLSRAMTLRDKSDELVQDSLLLALGSYQLAPSIEAYSTILQSLTISPPTSLITRYGGPVNDVVISADGKYVASASDDHTAMIWDAQAQRSIATIKLQDKISDIAFSSDSQNVYTSSAAGDVNITSLASGTTRRIYDFQTTVNKIFVSPGGDLLGAQVGGVRTSERRPALIIKRIDDSLDKSFAFLGESPGEPLLSSDWRYVAKISDQQATVFSTADGSKAFTTTAPTSIQETAFSPDGKLFALGAANGHIEVWDLSLKVKLKEFHQRDDASHLSFSPESNFLGTSDSETVWIWNLKTGQLQSNINSEDQIKDIVFSAGGTLVSVEVASISDGKKKQTASIWDSATGQQLGLLTHDGHIKKIVFSPDNKYVVTSGEDGAVRMWDIITPRLGAKVFGQQDWSEVSSTSLNNAFMAVTSTKNEVQVWDLQNQQLLSHWDHGSSVLRLAVSNNGRYIATAEWQHPASQEMILRIRDVLENKVLLTKSTSGVLEDIFVSDDGRMVLLSKDPRPFTEDSNTEFNCPSCDLHISSFEMSNGPTVMVRPSGANRAIWRPMKNSDGRWRVINDPRPQLYILDSQTGEERSIGYGDLFMYAVHNVNPLSIIHVSQDGTFLIVDNDKESESGSFAGPSKIAGTEGGAIPLSQDNKLLALEYEDGTIIVWDIKTQSERCRIKPEGSSQHVAFTSDGTHLVYESKKTAHVWDVNSGEEIATFLIAPEHDINAIFFTPDDKFGAKISNGFLTTLWQPTDLLNEACSRLNRNLTLEEWNSYLPGEPYQKMCPNLP
jgi:serine/threonine protein kinase/WD40 repeat protein